MPARADGFEPVKVLSGSVTKKKGAGKQGQLEVSGLAFYYREDEDARFLDLKTRWQTGHQNKLPPKEAIDFADQAYKASSMDAELNVWRFQGGPHPKTITAKVRLYNPTRDALLDVPIHVQLWAKVGDLLVESGSQLTAYGALRASARWEPVSLGNLKIPVIAPDEDQILEVTQFRLLPFLEPRPYQWPIYLKVVVTSPKFQRAEKVLTLLPDHFVLRNLDVN